MTTLHTYRLVFIGLLLAFAIGVAITAARRRS